MSILRYAGKVGRINGSLTGIRSANLVFIVQGDYFLNWYYPSGTIPGSNNPTGYFYFRSHSPNSAVINWGDGVVETIPFSEYDGSYYLASKIHDDISSPVDNYSPIPNHEFQTAIEGKRGVSIRILNPSSIDNFNVRYVVLHDALPKDISKLNNIDTLQILYTREIREFPFEYRYLANMSILVLTSLNTSSTGYFKVYPEGLLIPSLTRISITSTFDFSDLYVSNAYRLGELDKLDFLSCANNEMDDIPEEWGGMLSLKTLQIGLNNFLDIPENLNYISSITSLQVGCKVMVGWGNLILPNLTTLEVSYRKSDDSSEMDPDFGDTLLNCPKLKNLLMYKIFKLQEKFDEFIDNLYDFIVNNANITGTSADNWRSMVITAYWTQYPNGNYYFIPSGTYQEPAGYSQGTSNGSPASQYEKVWVLVNQYGFTFILKPE